MLYRYIYIYFFSNIFSNIFSNNIYNKIFVYTDNWIILRVLCVWAKHWWKIMGTLQLMENYQNLNSNKSMLGIHNVLPTPTGCTDWWCANPQMIGVGWESIYSRDIMEIKHFECDIKKPHRVCWIRFSSMQSAL